MRMIPLATRPLRLEVLEPRFCLALTVPQFSSLPGANHTIYLDFDGQITQNTAWNKLWNNPKITSPAYNIDGNATSFSAQELSNIQSIWKRVSEDFIPFQVNVTTVDPGVEALRRIGSTDKQWGVRVVITSDTEHTGAGGIGYVGSFTWNSDTPVFVFNTSEKAVAEAASHEVGHSLGLAHDGTSSSEYYSGHGSGDTSWAPIMGVGYSRNVSTWSRGEYKGANNNTTSANYGKGNDDLAIITGMNGFGYRGDDYGGDTLTAGTLTGPTVNASGIISTTADVDVFRFQAGVGMASLTIRPFTPGPDLDVKAELINSQGGTVFVADSPTSLTATINFSITSAGTYYLRVSGVGAGNPLASPPTGYTDYGSLGRYFITGSFAVSKTSGSGLAGSPGIPSLPNPPPPKLPSSLGSVVTSGSLTTNSDFSGQVRPNWDGQGIPPQPVMDAWSDFEDPDGDLPSEDSSGTAGTGPIGLGVVIVPGALSSPNNGNVLGNKDDAVKPLSSLSLLQTRLELEIPRSLVKGILEQCGTDARSSHDQVFAENDIDWTSFMGRQAKQTRAASVARSNH